MAHPDRTYTRLKNDQYYSNLNTSGIDALSSQSDNLIKDQARQLERTKQMQTLGLSQPQADANDVASGRSTPAVQQFDIASQVGSSSSSGRGSVATSGYATPHQPVDPFEVIEKLDELEKQQKAKVEANRQQVQGKVAESVPTLGAPSSGASASAGQPAIIPLTLADYEAKEMEYQQKTAAVLNSAYYSAKFGKKLDPTKLDKDVNGDLNDHFKNKLIYRLLESEIKGLHMKIVKQRKESSKPSTQFPDVELQQKGRKTK